MSSMATQLAYYINREPKNLKSYKDEFYCKRIDKKIFP